MLLKNFINWDNPGTAFITGASSGIGEAFAKALANQRFNLVLVARRKEKLEEFKSELEKNEAIKVQILDADLSKMDDIERLYSYISNIADLDVLINNAGFGTRGNFANVPFDSQRDMLFVHNVAPVYFCKAALQIMMRRGRGAIINVASIAAIVQLPQNVMYNATKTFLKVFTETLNIELENTGIKTQCLCPGLTRTEFHQVGDFKEFDSSLITESAWMSAEEVVKLSLDKFSEVAQDEVVFIPGEHNQALAKLWSDPKLGERTRKNMIKMGKIPIKRK
ncbi:MAG TPA: SDR family oxidoreductase [Candidatus Lokiarchaeia archaeon]